MKVSLDRERAPARDRQVAGAPDGRRRIDRAALVPGLRAEAVHERRSRRPCAGPRRCASGISRWCTRSRRRPPWRPRACGACGGARSTRRPISTGARREFADRVALCAIAIARQSRYPGPVPPAAPECPGGPSHANPRHLRRWRLAPPADLGPQRAREPRRRARVRRGRRGDRGAPRPAGGVQGVVRQGQPLEPRLVPRRRARRGPADPRPGEGRLGPARDHRRPRARPGQARRRGGGAAPDPRVPLAPDRPREGVRGDRAADQHQEGPVHGPRRRGARRRQGEGRSAPAA